MKNVLIAGAQSYIGDSFKEYLEQWPGKYRVSILETKRLVPKPEMFDSFDAVFCVAGIAHIKETTKNRNLFFDVNRDLVVSIAKAARSAGVGQFILLSSMSVYGLETGTINKATVPNPNTAYGQSKLEADITIKSLANDSFVFTCLRPPMVYGKNCTGNYQLLRKFALKSPVFPDYKNQRSMVYIGNLCEFVKECIDLKKSGLFFPQNPEYVNTSTMVKLIAEEHGKKIKLTKFFNWCLNALQVKVIKKLFGSLTYDAEDRVEKYRFAETIKLTEE